jgi:radical SAM protein with 4Fe4S-binding SPASM domain
MKDNYQELQGMRKIAEEIGIPLVCTFEIHNTINKSCKPKEYLAPLAESLKYEFNDYYDQIKRGERQPTQEKSDLSGGSPKNEYVYSCNVALNSFVIDYLGRMCPCMKLRHKGIKLCKSNYDEIWEGFKAYSEQVASDSYICKGCEALDHCDVCPAEMGFLYDDVEYRPASVCEGAIIRKSFYEGVMSYDEAINAAASIDECNRE